jgi:hypothetical protein
VTLYWLLLDSVLVASDLRTGLFGFSLLLVHSHPSVNGALPSSYSAILVRSILIALYL